MKNHPARWGLLVLVCLLATACQDRRDPVKPTTWLTTGLTTGLTSAAPALA